MRHFSIFLVLYLALTQGIPAQQLAVSPNDSESGPSESWISTRMIGSEESGDGVPYRGILLYSKTEDWDFFYEEPGTYYDSLIDFFHLEPIDSRALTFAIRATTTWIPGIAIVPERKNLDAPAWITEEFGLPYETRLDLGDDFHEFWDASDQLTLYFHAEGSRRRTELTFSLSRAPVDFPTGGSTPDTGTEPSDPVDPPEEVLEPAGLAWNARPDGILMRWWLKIHNPNDRLLSWDWIKINFLDKGRFRLAYSEIYGPSVAADSERTFHGSALFGIGGEIQKVWIMQVEGPDGIWGESSRQEED